MRKFIIIIICCMLICCNRLNDIQETRTDYSEKLKDGLSLVDSFYITKNTELLSQAIKRFEDIDEQHFERCYHKQMYINYCKALMAASINNENQRDLLYNKNVTIIEDYLRKSTSTDDYAVYELFFFKSLSSSRLEFIHYADSITSTLPLQKIDISIFVETFYPTEDNIQKSTTSNYTKIQQ